MHRDSGPARWAVPTSRAWSSGASPAAIGRRNGDRARRTGLVLRNNGGDDLMSRRTVHSRSHARDERERLCRDGVHPAERARPDLYGRERLGEPRQRKRHERERHQSAGRAAPEVAGARWPGAGPRRPSGRTPIRTSWSTWCSVRPCTSRAPSCGPRRTARRSRTMPLTGVGSAGVTRYGAGPFNVADRIPVRGVLR